MLPSAVLISCDWVSPPACLQLHNPFPLAPLSPHTLWTDRTSPSPDHQNPLSFSAADPGSEDLSLLT